MAFRTDDSQTACVFHVLGQLDIGTTTGHVGSDRNRTLLTRQGHDLGLFLVQLSVQYIVLDLTHRKHTAQ